MRTGACGITAIAWPLTTAFLLAAAPAAAQIGRSDWAGVDPGAREAAYAPQNARTTAGVLRQALGGAEGDTRAFQLDADTEAQRGTYRLTIPLIELPGRMRPTRLGLTYQARVWFGGSEANLAILDGDMTNAAGWSLGIVKVLGGVLVESDGTRRSARRSPTGSAREDVEVDYITTDGSNVRYSVRLEPPRRNALGRATAEVRYPDGTVIVLSGVAGVNPAGRTSALYSRLYATDVIDPAGNVTTIEYRDWGSATAAARPASMTDPLGRRITFHYNPSDQLIAITLDVGGVPRVLARLTYLPVVAYTWIDPSDPARDRMWATFAVQGIFFPATQSGYWFGDPDSYTRYGMLRKVVEQTAMVHRAASLAEEGVLSAGTTLRKREYDFPMTAPTGGNRNAFPRYTTMTESFVGVAGPLVTRYSISEQPGLTVVTVALPDGTKRETGQDPGTGLPEYRAILATDGSPVRVERFTWTPDATGARRLSILSQTDGSGRTRRTEYGYDSAGRLNDVRHYDWITSAASANAPLLRRERYEYLTSPTHQERGIGDLIRRAEIYGPASLLPEERTDYEYDSSALTPAPGLTRNVFHTPGFRPDLRARYAPTAMPVAGLLTRVSRWVAPGVPTNSSTVVSQATFSQGGALVSTDVAGRRTATYVYSAATGFALPERRFDGVPALTRRQTVPSTSMTWDLDTGELRRLSRPGKAPVQMQWDDAFRLARVWNADGESRTLTYANDGRTVEEQFFFGTSLLKKTTTVLDGRASPVAITTAIAGRPPEETRFEYDARGRVQRVAGPHAPGSPPAWTIFAFDAIGRPSTTTLPNGSVETTRYPGAGLPANASQTGLVSLHIDAAQRTRFVTTDALGRVTQVLTPSGATASAWTEAALAYDSRSNLLLMRTDANRRGGAIPARRFAYDGLSRMTHRYLLERAPSLDDSGAVSSRGTWSDVYAYDDLSNLVRHTDPRGVVVRYEYTPDATGRLQAVRHQIPAATRVAPTPDIEFDYATSGNISLPREVRVAGVLTQRIVRDARSRATEIHTSFLDYPQSPIVQRLPRDARGFPDAYAVNVAGRDLLAWDFDVDALGRRTAVSSTAGVPFRVADDLTSAGVKRLTFSSGSWSGVEELGIDVALNRVVRQTVRASNQTVVDRSFAYVEPSSGAYTGQIFRVRDNVASTGVTASYDPLGRLAAITTDANRRLAGFGWQYGYDDAGNRVASEAREYLPVPLPTPGRRGGLGTVIVPTSPPFRTLDASAADGQAALAIDALTNRIVSPGFEYDAAGNVTRLPRKDGTALQLQYDAVGRLVRVAREGTADWEAYAYGAGPDRMRSNASTGLRRFSIGAGTYRVNLARDVTGALVLEGATAWLQGRQVVRVDGDGPAQTTSFLHQFPLGQVLTSPGRPAAASSFTPFGIVLDQSGSARFHAYERTAFGLDHAVHRDYDPETGRFLQPDPLGELVFEADDPQSFNLYAFTRNDPVNRVDPDGLDDCAAGAVPEVMPDGGTLCTYAYWATTFKTVVAAQRGDGQGVLDLWGADGGMLAPWQLGQQRSNDEQVQNAVDEGLLKRLRKLREQRDPCTRARAKFASATQAYSRVAGDIFMFNQEVLETQFEGIELIADISENILEQVEDYNGNQAAAAIWGRGAHLGAMRAKYQRLQFQRARLVQDRQDALKAMADAQWETSAYCE